jgi:Kef-type K+ transport system membrane component KefB/Trk K+ transport system NAD-binding subunit
MVFFGEIGIIGELGIAFFAATVAAYIARFLKQPILLGYIIAGIVVGPLVLNLVSNSEVISLMSELGIAFLLFLTGLEISLSRLSNVGKVAIVAGFVQIGFTLSLGYIAAVILGFTGNVPLYIGIALAFSSTMIVVKLLADKNELDTLHGRIILGVLLVQDIIAIIALTLLPSVGNFSPTLFIPLALKGLLLFGSVAVASKFIAPYVFRVAAKSQQLLFLSSVSWCLSIAFFSNILGYSLAIGAFLAGLSLASLSYNIEIISRVKSLRDFFSILFFVSLGMQLVFTEISVSIAKMAASVAIFSGIVIIGNPIIISLVMKMMGYKRRTAILSGLSLAQISEFSLIVIYLGSSLGHIDTGIVTIIVAVASVTIAATGYIIKYDSLIYSFVSKSFVFKKLFKKNEYEASDLDYRPHKKYDIILCGHNRIGYSILNALKSINEEVTKPFLVVDFNPDVVRRMQARKIPCMYGDVGDEEVLNRLNLKETEIIVSTIPSLQDNLMILKKAKKEDGTKRKDPVVMVTANFIDDALALYKEKADYVILPHFLGGEKVAVLLESWAKGPKNIIATKLEHILELNKRKELKQEHPDI